VQARASRDINEDRLSRRPPSEANLAEGREEASSYREPVGPSCRTPAQRPLNQPPALAERRLVQPERKPEAKDADGPEWRPVLD
jgi:hypothetical protein